MNLKRNLLLLILFILLAESVVVAEFICGNNIAEPGETCDGTNLRVSTCHDWWSSYTSGSLGCTTECHIDTSGCRPSIITGTCWDGNINSMEECEVGNKYLGKDCTYYGFGSGTLSCYRPECIIDTTGCNKITRCGDNVCETGESIGNCAADCKSWTINRVYASGDIMGTNVNTALNAPYAKTKNFPNKIIDIAIPTKIGSAVGRTGVFLLDDSSKLYFSGYASPSNYYITSNFSDSFSGDHCWDEDLSIFEKYGFNYNEGKWRHLKIMGYESSPNGYDRLVLLGPNSFYYESIRKCWMPVPNLYESGNDENIIRKEMTSIVGERIGGGGILEATFSDSNIICTVDGVCPLIDGPYSLYYILNGGYYTNLSGVWIPTQAKCKNMMLYSGRQSIYGLNIPFYFSCDSNNNCNTVEPDKGSLWVHNVDGYYPIPGSVAMKDMAIKTLSELYTTMCVDRKKSGGCFDGGLRECTQNNYEIEGIGMCDNKRYKYTIGIDGCARFAIATGGGDFIGSADPGIRIFSMEDLNLADFSFIYKTIFVENDPVSSQTALVQKRRTMQTIGPYLFVGTMNQYPDENKIFLKINVNKDYDLISLVNPTAFAYNNGMTYTAVQFTCEDRDDDGWSGTNILDPITGENVCGLLDSNDDDVNTHPACDEDNVCDAGEGCLCSDCNGLHDSCANGLVCSSSTQTCEMPGIPTTCDGLDETECNINNNCYWDDNVWPTADICEPITQCSGLPDKLKCESLLDTVTCHWYDGLIWDWYDGFIWWDTCETCTAGSTEPACTGIIPSNCGNGVCGSGETCSNCAADCGACQCNDGIDNDGDGCKDLIDNDCINTNDNTESSSVCSSCISSTEICSDNLDNDCDGNVDCLDSNCNANTYCVNPPQCSDDLDNDNNGCKDFPSDSGCTTANDNTESGGNCGTPITCPTEPTNQQVCSGTAQFSIYDAAGIVCRNVLGTKTCTASCPTGPSASTICNSITIPIYNSYNEICKTITGTKTCTVSCPTGPTPNEVCSGVIVPVYNSDNNICDIVYGIKDCSVSCPNGPTPNQICDNTIIPVYDANNNICKVITGTKTCTVSCPTGPSASTICSGMYAFVYDANNNICKVITGTKTCTASCPTGPIPNEVCSGTYEFVEDTNGYICKVVSGTKSCSPTPSTCGNPPTCEPSAGETCSNCPSDCGNCPPPPTDECDANSDCEDNEECISGRCVVPPCTVNSCPTGQICDSNLDCIPAPICPGQIPNGAGGCTNYEPDYQCEDYGSSFLVSECPDGYSCVNGNSLTNNIFTIPDSAAFDTDEDGITECCINYDVEDEIKGTCWNGEYEYNQVTGDSYTLSYGPCIPLETGASEGKRDVYVDGLMNNPTTEDCTILPTRKVPFSSALGILIGLAIIITFYITRKKH